MLICYTAVDVLHVLQLTIITVCCRQNY